MQQVLSALVEIHKFNVIHRDLKPANILINKNGEIKIADFGMSRFIASPGRAMTKNLVTEYYRPPELFFGAKYYSFAVDIWSVGCIFAEFYLRKPLFWSEDPTNQIDTLTKIFMLLGIPDVYIHKL